MAIEAPKKTRFIIEQYSKSLPCGIEKVKFDEYKKHGLSDLYYWLLSINVQYQSTRSLWVLNSVLQNVDPT
jgi:hypothetical protein